MRKRATLLTLLISAGVLPAASAQSFGFDDQKPGEAPKGFTCGLTGRGKPGTWTLTRDDQAASGPLVLEQSDTDATSYRFPHCVADSVSVKDVELSVRFRPISGNVDQAAGLVWRYRDKDNYYVVRANAREGNVVLYKVEKGKRTDLPLKGEGRTYGKKANVPAGAWSELKLVARGNLFQVFLGPDKLYEVEDATFSDAGKVGVWTKADSVARFDDLKIAAPRP
jgi:hypothetical protein